MESIEEVRNASLSVISTYEKWVSVITDMIKKSACLMGEHTGEEVETILSLRETLARSAGLRKKDFDTLMEKVLVSLREKEKEVCRALDDLKVEEGRMVGNLKKIVNSGDRAAYESIKKDVMPNQRKRESTVARLLMELNMEQSELDATLKGLVSKGEKVKVRDLKAALKAVEGRMYGKVLPAERLLEEFVNIRRKMLARWSGLFLREDEACPGT